MPKRRLMPGISRRSDTAMLPFNMRLPSDLVGKAVGQPVIIHFPASGTAPERTVSARLGAARVRFSLSTADPVVANERSAIANAYLRRLFAELRRGPHTLSQKQVEALSGDVYRLVVERFDDNPGSPDRWAALKALSRAAREGRITSPPTITADVPDERPQVASLIGAPTTEAVNALRKNPTAVPTALEKRYGVLVDWVLAEKGVVITDETRAALIAAVDRAATDVAWRMKRAAAGDWTPDPKEARFPAWSPPKATQETRKGGPAGGPSWDQIIAAWENQHKARRGRASLRSEWRSRVTKFAEWCGVAPVVVTDDQVRGWRDRRLKEVTAVTVNADLMMIRTIFGHAIKERLLSGPNPADDIRVSGARRAAQNMQGFTDDEAALILSAALRMNDYRKWVPMLSAFTGSRVSTIMNLRPCDVKRVSGYDVIEISADAGPVKTRASERMVPIHRAILDAGFLDFVAKRAREPRLFFDERRLRSANTENPGKGRINSLRRFLHGIEGVAIGRAHGKDPNHAWRHWLKSKLREVGVPDSVSDGITGHSPGSEGAGYGRVTVKAMADALAKVPVPVVIAEPAQLPVAAE